MEKKAPARGTKTRTHRIDEILFQLGEVFSFDLNEPTIELYHKILKPYPIDDVSRACTTWLSSHGERKFDFFGPERFRRFNLTRNE